MSVRQTTLQHTVKTQSILLIQHGRGTVDFLCRQT